MAVFLSYAREDEDVVRVLRDDVEQLGLDAWFDRQIAGAAEWWEAILHQIRSCDVFVLALSKDWLESRACQAEVQYALDIDRPVLPVLVRTVDMALVNKAIAKAHYVDFQTHDSNSSLKLARALFEVRKAGPLPDPLPDPPPVPMKNLGNTRAQLERESLTSAEQRSIVTEMLPLLNNPEDRKTAIELLRVLHQRSDVTRSIADEIDGILRSRAAEAGTGTANSRTSTSAIQQFPRWRSLKLSIADGRCTPVVGPGLTDSLIGQRRVLASKWADTFDFPMAMYQADDLPQVAQFVKVENDDPSLRAELSNYLRQKLMSDYPDAVTDDLGAGRLDEMITQAWRSKKTTQPDNSANNEPLVEPHEFLATLPLPIYITANPSNLLARALEDSGRSPVVEFCRWRSDVRGWPESIMSARPLYVPSFEEPLVFHLFGNLTWPESVVLTEDDYFDFLINVTRNRTYLIPSPVLAALADSALMFLGFGLEQWDFRVLLRSLVSPDAGKQRHSHVAAQIDLGQSVISPDRARGYLESYFAHFKDMTIDICWCSVDEFVTTLAEYWQSTP